MTRQIAVTFAFMFPMLTGAHAVQPAPEPILALWEYDGWAAPTAERPLGLRFVLLEDGSVLFSPDDPAWDRLIPAGFYQAKLSPDEIEALVGRIDSILRREARDAQLPTREGNWTAFYFRDSESGAPQRAEVAGHPCLAHGRVFSATAPVEGLRAAQNSEDREALSPALREVCNLLTQFHHEGAKDWNPAELPAPIPR
ncbi:MAG TPA: hypothetical protein VG742_21930 [Dongiaceae bacterium]|nr:hypothetical protein [Dongiaceae bacterium]